MNPLEEFKRKKSGITTFKNNPPLIAIKDRKKTDISKEKNDKKIIIPHERVPSKILPHYQDQNEKSVKPINFRNLKDTVPKKQHNPPKTQLKIGKPNTQFHFKTNKQQPNIPEPHGIAINVNIQNMLPKNQNVQRQYYTKNERPMMGEDKRKIKKPMISQMKTLEDLECTEEMNFKRTPVQKKSKIVNNPTQKIPLIEKKTLRGESSQNKAKPSLYEQKELIRKLEKQADTMNSNFQTETLFQLDHRQNYYLIPPHYIEKNQKNFTWMMRAILVEWMMHVSYQFSMKRQTFHIAVNIADLYMSKKHHLQKSQFQLVGAASMFIASKLEEFQPKCSQDFATTTKGRYTATQIKSVELKICKTLNYRLNPPTIYMWANRFMLQWDIFVEQDPYSFNHPLFLGKSRCFFKRFDSDSLRLFRELMQYIDCSLLHIHTVQYKPKLLACAFLYLVLGLQFEFFNKNEIANEFPDSSRYLLDYENPFNDFFMTFLENSLGIILIDLLPTIQYAASFFLLALSFEDPIIPEKYLGEEGVMDMHLEEYSSFQTHNPNMTTALKHRNKNLR